MKSLKGTKTAANLLKAFAGESQARMRYTYYASVAKKQGYVQISNIFTETAANEQEHAKIFYKYLKEDYTDEAIEITASYPVSLHGDTRDNLLAAAASENEEWTKLYPEFSEIAKEEGFPEVAQSFKLIAQIEKHHDERYTRLAKEVEDGTLLTKKEEKVWKCLNCGFLYVGEKAPKLCPACKHPGGYFEINVEEY